MIISNMLRAASLTVLMSAHTVLAAPMPGERYMVDGRCVTLNRVQGGQVDYAWSEGNVSGSGSLPADWLGVRCTSGTARPPATTEPAGPVAKPPAATNPRSADAPRAAATPATDAGFAQQILRAHNRYRCMHGVPPLQWKAEIAAYAQRWIEKAGFNHSDSYRSPLGPMGENLYASSAQPAGPDAAASWYSESQGYDYRREGTSGTGHFTAMIWKDARFVGCGRAGGIVSCNYASDSGSLDCTVPNMRGCYQQQVLPVSRDAQSCDAAQ